VDLLTALAGRSAGHLPHVNGSLRAHLEGTRDLLQKWGDREALCTAGLFHAAYGTAGYTHTLVPVSERHRVTALIGAEAERLVYLFGACDREFWYDQIVHADRPRFRDRLLQSDCELSDDDQSDLCELTMANELQIILEQDDPSTSIARYRELFDRMQRWVSAPARAEWTAAIARNAAARRRRFRLW
jgi:hypothetical protein